MEDNPDDDGAQQLALDERAELEAAINRREKVLAQAKLDRRERVRETGVQRGVEPHRNWHAYALGADLADCGLRGQDATALMGLRSLPIGRVVRLLLAAHDEAPGQYVGRLLPIIVDRHRDELHARGLVVSWSRRWVVYQADLTSWKAQSGDIKAGPWRERAMTAGQRELIRVTATLLDMAVPGALTRGDASDWLDANGANLTFRQGN